MMNKEQSTMEKINAQAKAAETEQAVQAEQARENALYNRLNVLAPNDGYTLVFDEQSGEKYACYRVGETLTFKAESKIAQKAYNPRPVYIPKEIDPEGILIDAARSWACKCKYDERVRRLKNSISHAQDMERLLEFMDDACETFYKFLDGIDAPLYAAAAIGIDGKDGKPDEYAEKLRRVVALYLESSVKIGFDFPEMVEKFSAAGTSKNERTELLEKLCGWLKSGWTANSRLVCAAAKVGRGDVEFFASTLTKGLTRKASRIEKTYQNETFITNTLSLYCIDLFQKNGADEKRYEKALAKAAAAEKAAKAEKREQEKAERAAAKKSEKTTKADEKPAK